MLNPSASTSAVTTTYRNTSDVVPVPDAYAACRVCPPIPSASCGVPVTSTALLNVTVATTVSPRSNVVPTGGEATVRFVTPGGPCRPSTLCAAAFVTALDPKPSAAAAAPGRTSAIVPPFSVSALAPMLIPSVSASVGRIE